MKAYSDYEKIPFREGPPTAVDLLDASTQLRMAEPEEEPTVRFPTDERAVKPGASLRKEATLVGVLTVVFTAIFWVLICYLRSR